jgi:malate dehydrogenase (oxaloacetate-decarboxylating)(NADP+)
MPPRARSPERSRIVYAEGEDERVLRAVQIAVDEKLAVPILVGRPSVIERASSATDCGSASASISPSSTRSTTPATANTGSPITAHSQERRDPSICQARDAAAYHADRRDALKKGEADGLICGTISTTSRHLKYIDRVIGRRSGVTCTAR